VRPHWAAPQNSACGRAAAPIRQRRVTLGSNGPTPTREGLRRRDLGRSPTDSGLEGVKTNHRRPRHLPARKAISTYLQGNPEDPSSPGSRGPAAGLAKKKAASPSPPGGTKIGVGFSEATSSSPGAETDKYIFVPAVTTTVGRLLAARASSRSAVPGSAERGASYRDRQTQRRSEGRTLPVASGIRTARRVGGGQMEHPRRLRYSTWRTKTATTSHMAADARVSGLPGPTSAAVRPPSTMARTRPLLTSRGAPAGRSWQDEPQFPGRQEVRHGRHRAFSRTAGSPTSRYAPTNRTSFPKEVTPPHGQDAVGPPTDGFMLARRPRTTAAARTVLEFPAGAQSEGEERDMAVEPSKPRLSTSRQDGTLYPSLQTEVRQLIASASPQVSSRTRPADPGFISTVVLPGRSEWIGHPDDGSAT